FLESGFAVAVVLAHVLDVTARAERSPGAGNEDRPDARIFAQTLEQAAPWPRDPLGKRISRMRPVEGHGGYTFADLGQEFITAKVDLQWLGHAREFPHLIASAAPALPCCPGWRSPPESHLGNFRSRAFQPVEPDGPSPDRRRPRP